MTRVLLLAGTAEARTLAKRWPWGTGLVASLAGATSDPLSYPCETRIGGFGGADGLAAYLSEANIAAIIDATHPFAERISANAAVASRKTGTPRIVLRRASWVSEANWTEFRTLQAAADTLPTVATVLLTTGRKETGAFAARPDVRFLLRSVEDPGPLPEHIRSIRARPPFALEDELALMRREAITHLVTKNAGGTRPAKLAAAANLGIPVFSISMPPAPPGRVATTVDEALEWITRTGVAICTSRN